MTRDAAAGRQVPALRLGRDGLVLLGIILAGFVWWQLTATGGDPVDARYYWVANRSDLYPIADQGLRNGYVYTPAFEIFIGWSRLLPFDVFVAAWRAILLAIVVFLAGPFTPLVLFWTPVASEVNAGNIQLLLALAVVLGFRWPATWSFVLLTKVTPGVGLLWFVVRREWRALATVAGVTAALAAAAFLVNPGAWGGYLHLLTASPAPSVAPYYLPFWVRLPFAVAFVGAGALTGRRWPVVVGATLALPVYYIISSSMLIGVLPFLREALGRAIADPSRVPGLGRLAAAVSSAGSRG
jgi:hypothetical protein